MPLELKDVPAEGERRVVLPGDTGLLVLAKVKSYRSVNREGLKKIKAVADIYFKEMCPEAFDSGDKGDGDAKPMEVTEAEEPTKDTEATATEDGEPAEDNKSVKEENGNGKESTSPVANTITFHPIEVYDNCSFFLSNLLYPADFAHYFFGQIADHPEWPQPKFPLRVMPVQIVCPAKPKEIERAVRPLLEETFGGDESLRFSFILHTRRPNPDITMHEAEAVIRNCLWSINPNCVQCLKYQDYGIMIEVIEGTVFVGIAKDFNQLGRYNTSCLLKGRDMKDMMSDSEDEISDDPHLSEEGNVKRKLEIKRKRRQEKYAKEREEAAKRLKAEEEENNSKAEEVNGD